MNQTPEVGILDENRTISIYDRIVLIAVNAFVYAYAGDAVLSLLDVTLSAEYGFNALLVPRQVLATLVFNGSFFLLIWAIVSQKLGGIQYCLLPLSAIWLNLGAQPIPWWFIENNESLQILLVLLQSLFALTAILRIRMAGSWLVRPNQLRTGRGVFKWFLHALPRAGFAIIVCGLAVILGIPMQLQAMSSDFVSFRADGIYLKDQIFERADGKKVRLVGMIHFGDYWLYRQMITSFTNPSTVILEEGITDNNNILNGATSGKRAAPSRRGIVYQPRLDDILDARRINAATPAVGSRLDLLNADLDMSELTSATVDMLRQLAALRPSAKTSSSEINLLLLLQQISSIQIDANVMLEVLQTRNMSIFRHLDRVLPDYEQVLIPWGALHMPGIASHLQTKEFVPLTPTWHKILSWQTSPKTQQTATPKREPPPEPAYTQEELKSLASQGAFTMIEHRRGGLLLESSASTTPDAFYGGLPTRYEGEAWPVNNRTGRPMHFIFELHKTSENADLMGPIESLRLFIDYEAFEGYPDPHSYRVLFTLDGEPPRTRIEWTTADQEELQAASRGSSPNVAKLITERQDLQMTPGEFVNAELMEREYDQRRDPDLDWYLYSEVERTNALLHSNVIEPFDLSVIGGYPSWVQYPEASTLPFFLQLVPEGDLAWGDGGHFYLFLNKNAPRSGQALFAQSY